MQDLGYELRRISIPRTPVNKGKRKGRDFDTPARWSGGRVTDPLPLLYSQIASAIRQPALVAAVPQVAPPPDASTSRMQEATAPRCRPRPARRTAPHLPARGARPPSP